MSEQAFFIFVYDVFVHHFIRLRKVCGAFVCFDYIFKAALLGHFLEKVFHGIRRLEGIVEASPVQPAEYGLRIDHVKIDEVHLYDIIAFDEALQRHDHDAVALMIVIRVLEKYQFVLERPLAFLHERRELFASVVLEPVFYYWREALS